MDDIQKAIQDARAERLNHMYGTFSNLDEVRADEEALKKSEDTEIEKSENDFNSNRSGSDSSAPGSPYKKIETTTTKNGKTTKTTEYWGDEDEINDEEDDGEGEEVEDDDDEEKAESYQESEDRSAGAWARASMKESDENLKSNLGIKKSDIMGAISGYGDSKIKVSKTGKEIKEQVDSVIMPELTANLAAKEIEANNKLKDCGAAPTHCPDPWWTDDVRMDCGYKIYDWREREWCSNENRMYPSLSAEDSAEKKGNCPTSEAEAKARCEYNDIVRCICNIKVDINACEILKTLKDTSTYELTPRQVLTLRF